MFNSSSPTDMQATNNLFGGCISVWEKEEEEWYCCVHWTIHGTFPEEDAAYILYNNGDLD